MGHEAPMVWVRARTLLPDALAGGFGPRFEPALSLWRSVSTIPAWCCQIEQLGAVRPGVSLGVSQGRIDPPRRSPGRIHA
jgi:hypothetical protein